MVKFYAKKRAGMVRAKSGKYYYPKRRKTMGKKAMRMTAKQVALSLKITKKKDNIQISRPFGIQPAYAGGGSTGQPVTLTGVNTLPAHWQVFNPLYLPATQGQHDSDDREDMRIYANNCQAEIEVYPNKKNVECLYIRVIYGYYKGLPNLNTANLLDNTLLESLLPQHSSRLDPANQQTRQFRIISDKKVLKVPKQLYDANWSDDQTSLAEAIFGENPVTEGQEVTNALWTPFKRMINFKFNKQFTYQNSDPDSIVGANPFIAVGVFPCGDAAQFKSFPGANATLDGIFSFNDDEGTRHDVKVEDTTNPSPILSCKFKTYFKDVM